MTSQISVIYVQHHIYHTYGNKIHKYWQGEKTTNLTAALKGFQATNFHITDDDHRV